MEQDAQDFLSPGNQDDDSWEDAEEESTKEAIEMAIHDIMAAYGGVPYRRDGRTWHQHVETMEKNWSPLLPQLTDMFLTWRYPPSESAPVDIDPEDFFDIDVIDIYGLQTLVTITRGPDELAVIALAHHGYLGNSPVNLSLAISFKMLELFCCIKLVKASFSAEAFAKLVCYQYYIPYRPLYQKALADALDIYLTICCFTFSHVMCTLERNTLDWRARNACPPALTSWRAENLRSSPASYVWMAIIRSSAWEPQPKANVSRSTAGRQESDDDSNNEPGPSHHAKGDPTGGQTRAPTPCTSNWKAASAEENKRMWGIFEETDVFACACRHSLVLWLMDMVRSGELTKYPLAIVAKSLVVLCTHLMIGYDIGCDFLKTVNGSSLRLKVAFHPNNITGMGLEDLEGLERIFSSSNQLAPIIHYVSHYRRTSLINLFFHQWDDEKYAHLGLMLYKNLVQALRIVHEQGPILEKALESLQLLREDLYMFAVEEQKFFLQLCDKQDSNLHRVAYVEALQELRLELLSASHWFNVQAPQTPELRWSDPCSGPTDYNSDLSDARKHEIQCWYLDNCLKQLIEEVTDMEEALNIDVRWQPEDPSYQETLQYMATRNYQRALGKLQRLVILRPCELYKMNLAQTGNILDCR
ncbi:hypothetical protein FKP32DRAFT_1671949 [Trametes sanguinea]|nr:hypothetical protein FKP32DRAFT_1671949 [Trametes sanguinea]